MKEKKKSVSRVIVRAALILLLLTLISGCFLGSTFARYVSKGDDSFSAGIAKWEIEGAAEGSGGILTNLNEFSPNMAEYDSSTDRSRSVTVDLFTITNSGDVAAYIKIDLGTTATLYSDTNGESTVTIPPSPTTGNDAYAPDQNELNAIFTVKVAPATVAETNGNSGGNSSTAAQTGPSSSDYAGMYYLPADHTLTVKGTVTWRTDLDSDKNPSDNIGDWGGITVVDADLRDTWIAQNAVAVGWSYTWYAVQGNELPLDGEGVSETPETNTEPVTPTGP